jgi:cytochrome c oxidase subunit 3
MGILSRISGKPWLQQGPLDGDSAAEALPVPNAKLGLWIFLAVVTSLFGLFLSAFMMRMQLPDCRPLDLPLIVWINTLVLLMASAGMQYARNAARDGRLDATRIGFAIGGALAIVFLVGQLLAWHQLRPGDSFTATNPALAFFYLLTAVHGLHLAGGLYVWAATSAKVGAGLKSRDLRDIAALRLSIELCSTYWHFLLVVWLVIFAFLLKR